MGRRKNTIKRKLNVMGMQIVKCFLATLMRKQGYSEWEIAKILTKRPIIKKVINHG